MAQSQITQIYGAIAAWTPTYDTAVTVGVRSYNGLTPQLHESDAPMRMLLVTDPQNNQGNDYQFVALGTTTTMRWFITDRLFIEPVDMDGGYKSHQEKIVLYLRSYGEVVRQNRGVVPTAHVIGFRAYPGVFRWPNYGGGTPWHGIDIILEIEEYMTGA